MIFGFLGKFWIGIGKNPNKNKNIPDKKNLTKPIERYGKENYKIKNIPKGTWFRIF